MPKITEQEIRAFEALRGTHVLEYIARTYAELQEQLVTQRDPHVLTTLQGQAQQCKHLLSLIDAQRFSTNGKRG